MEAVAGALRSLTSTLPGRNSNERHRVEAVQATLQARYVGGVEEESVYVCVILAHRLLATKAGIILGGCGGDIDKLEQLYQVSTAATFSFASRVVSPHSLLPVF